MSDEFGFASVMKDINETFKSHERLLLVLMKLKIIGADLAGVIQRNFEQDTWSKVKNGDYDEYN